MAGSGFLLALSAICVTCLGVAAMPAHAAEGSFLESAVYEVETGEMTIHLREAVDPFSVYANRISVHDGGDADGGGADIFLSAPEFVRVGDDRRLVVFEPSPASRNALLSMADPVVRLEPGSFVSVADGEPNGAAEAPLTVNRGDATIPDMLGPTDILIARSTYSADSGGLVLYFDDAIDPFSIHVSRIAILHDGCDGISLSSQEFARVGADQKSVLFELDAENRRLLSGMTNPRIHLAPGAFVDKATRDGNGAGGVPLSVDGTAIPSAGDARGSATARAVSCHLTYRVEPPAAALDSSGLIPEFAAGHAEAVSAAVRAGLDAWTALNPGITFEEVDAGRPDISIIWIEYDGEHLGVGCLDCLRTGAYIHVVLERPDCRGDPVAYDYGAIRNIVAHELGHNLGLEHHADQGHLMYPQLIPPSAPNVTYVLEHSEHNVQVPFDTLGYTIPEPIPWYLVGEKDLLDSYDGLRARIDVLDENYNAQYAVYRSASQAYNDALDTLLSVIADLGLVLDDDNVIHTSSQAEVDAVRPLVDDLNRKANDSNEHLRILRLLDDDRDAALADLRPVADRLNCIKNP